MRPRVLRKLSNLANEWHIGIATGGLETARYRPGAVFYATIDYGDTRRVLRQLDLKLDDTFVDVGAGKGRVVCLAAKYLMWKAVGIECDPRLADIARTNVDRMRGRVTATEIRTEAAEEFDYSAATVLYLFNPFEADILDIVLHKIKADRGIKPLRLAFVMESPAQEAVFREHPWLKRLDRWPAARGPAVAFYRTHGN